jgi:uncharacterized protein YjbJ (UPF0337 family)
MKSEQVEGVVEKVAGKAQSAVGKLLGDSKLEAEGAGRQAAGQLTQTYGMPWIAYPSSLKRNQSPRLQSVLLLCWF